MSAVGSLPDCHAHLDRFGTCRRALVLGDGDGRFLADLVHTHPHIEVDSLDISPGMVALARRRIASVPGAANRVRFILADARTDPLPGTGYDLVVTNFFLDCFRPTELAAVVHRVAVACAPRALWADGERCFGVVTDEGRIQVRATIFATGGAAALWARTTNPWGAIGAGPVMAHAAGAVDPSGTAQRRRRLRRAHRHAA